MDKAERRMSYASKEAQETSISLMRRTLAEVGGLTYAEIQEKISLIASNLRELIDGIPTEVVVTLCRLEFTKKINLPESASSSSAAVLEIIGLVAISRDYASLKSPLDVDINSVVEKSLGYASQILTLGNYLTLIRNTSGSSDMPAFQIKGRIESETLGIRGKQYVLIEEYLYEQLFSHPNVAPIFLETMGFSYDNFKTVRNAITNLRIIDIRRCEELVRQFSRDSDKFRDKLTNEGLNINPMRISPRRIADETGILISAVERILNLFSVHVPTSIPSIIVHEYIKNMTPTLFGKLIQIDEDFLELTPSRLGQDILRDVFENLLMETNKKRFQAYSDARGKIAEQIADDALSRILQKTHLLANYKFKSKDFEGEVDLVFECDDRLLIAEVKAGDIERTTNSGNLHLVKRALREKLQVGVSQASKFAHYLRADVIGNELQRKINLCPGFKDFKVIIALDNLGTIGITYRSYLEKHVDIASDVWLLSLHDLLVISVVDLSVEDFFTYVEFRSKNEIGRNLEAMEELDIWIMWLQGPQYFEKDSFIHTHTDKLDQVFESLTEFPCPPIQTSQIS